MEAVERAAADEHPQRHRRRLLARRGPLGAHLVEEVADLAGGAAGASFPLPTLRFLHPAASVADRRTGTRPQPARRQGVEHPGEDLEDDRVAAAAPRGPCGAAVVEEEDVARREAGEQAAGDRRRVALDGVEAAPGPGDVVQAGARGAPSRGADCAGRRGRGRAAGGRPVAAAIALLGALDLPPQQARRVAGEEVGVGVGVVLDPVAAAGDLGGEAGMGAGAAADDEEGGPHAGAVQQVEHPRGDLGVGAVVEGEGDLPAAGGGVREAEQVRRPPTEPRGQRLAAVSATWLATRTPATVRQWRGAAARAAAPAACRASEPSSRAGGR